MTKISKQNLKTNLLCKFVFGITLFFVWANFVNAQIVITEIMYNPEGSDTGKEWIEVYNNGNETIDLTGWKLFEAETNHKINPVEDGGSLSFPPGSYALIIDNFGRFSENYSSFSGLVFDSAYSLSNTGESLIIRNTDLVDVDSVNYSSDLGADGDNNSLQFIDNKWVSASPTIGRTNSVSVVNSSTSVNSEEVTTNQNSSTTDFPLEPQIFANAGKDRKVIVGADTLFEAVGLGAEKKPLQNARYSWSFGDGGSFEGKKTLYAYKYPSKYVVVLNVSSGEYTASDRIIVEALPADIVITEVNQLDGYIELYNRSGYELNLSWWRVRSGNEYFSLPKDTIILPNNKIRLFNKVTKFNLLDLNQTYLLYPNGEIVNKYAPVVSDVRLRERSEATYLPDRQVQENKGSKSQTANLLGSSQVIKQVPDTNSQNPKQEEVTFGVEDREDQLAFVAGAVNKDNSEGLFNKWTFSLLGLVLVSVVGVLFTKGLEREKNLGREEDLLKPEDFNILEDDE